MIGSSAAAALKILLNGDASNAIKAMGLVERRGAEMVNRLKSQGKALIGVGAGALGGFAFTSIKMGEQAGELVKQSQQAGMAAENWQRLKYAVEQNEGSAEALVNSMIKLRRTTAEANQGGAAAQAIFDRLGISFRNNDGAIRSTNELLFDLSDAWVSCNGQGEKAADIQKLLGKVSKDLIPFLALGRQGILDYMSAARGVISDDTLKKMKDWADRWKEVKLQLTEFAMEAIKPLLPYLNKAADFIDRMCERFKALSPETKKSMGLLFLFGSMALVAGGAIIYLAGVVKGLTILMSPLGVKILGVVVGLDLAYRVGGAAAALIGLLIAQIGKLLGYIPGLEALINIFSKLHGGTGNFSFKGMENIGNQIVDQGLGILEGGLIGEAKSLVNKIDLGIFGNAAAAGAKEAARPPSGPLPTPSIFGGVAAMPLPQLSFGRTVARGQNINLNINVDTASQAVEAIDDFLSEHID